MSHKRVNEHDEPIDRMKKHGILIDGEGVLDWRHDQDPAADLLEDRLIRGPAPIFFRVHPAQRATRALCGRQLPRPVRIDRGRTRSAAA